MRVPQVLATGRSRPALAVTTQLSAAAQVSWRRRTQFTMGGWANLNRIAVSRSQLSGEQFQDEVADRIWLREERVMASVDLDDIPGPLSKPALSLRWGA